MQWEQSVTNPIQVLVVDDDPVERASLRLGFQQSGFRVIEACDEQEALATLSNIPIRLVALDLKSGHHNRIGLARKIKTLHNIPVIIVTSQGEPHERVDGLEHGADDYIVKPFQMREMIIRANAVLLRYEEIDQERHRAARYTFDSSVLDTKARVLRHINGRVVDLTETEFQLLQLFLQHPDRVLSRDELWKVLRSHDWSPFDRAIDGHISRLRHKIEHHGAEMIRSVRGVGYVFVDDVVQK